MSVPSKPADLAPGETVPVIAIRGGVWHLNDALAEDLAPGRVQKAAITLRIEELPEFADGIRWTTATLGLDHLRE